MAANALAIARIAELADRPEQAARFQREYESLKAKLNDALWDTNANFYKVQLESGDLSDAREAIGFIPWMFNLAPPERVVAWKQLTDPNGFSAPRGLTTAERRHPAFRTHGTGTCEWDGAVWPFATTQTLNGLANVLRGPAQEFVTKGDYFDALQTYARSHQKDGQPYIGEYHDENTGDWLITGPKVKRSRHYNHSTFCDLVITGLVGLVPRDDSELVVHPLLADNSWDWFCLDDVWYHGQRLTIIWDRTGDHYGKGAGLSLWSNGKLLARGKDLSPLRTTLVNQASN